MALGIVRFDFTANSIVDFDQDDSSIIRLSDGRFVVVWQSITPHLGIGNNYDIKGRIFNADGSPALAAGSTNEFAVSTATFGDQFLPQVTALANGRFMVTWYSRDNGLNFDIRGRLYNADGTPVAVNGSTDDFVLGTTNANNQVAPSITTLADGRFVVVWATFNTPTESDIRGRIFNADGTPFAVGGSANDFLINTSTANSQLAPSVDALAGGGFIVSWTSNHSGAGTNYDLMARAFNGDGTPASVNGTTNDTFVRYTNPFSTSAFSSDVATLADGRYVFVWRTADGTSDYNIRGRIYDANGLPAQVNGSTTDFVVNSTASRSEGDPQIVALADGRFLVIWQSFDTTPDVDVRGRMFLSDGTAAGAEFLIGSLAATYQSAPAVTQLLNGNIVLSFTLQGTTSDPASGDGSGHGIKTVILDPDVFQGDTSNDAWRGGKENDVFRPGGGPSNTFDGGAGWDVAVYTTPRGLATISAVINGYRTINTSFGSLDPLKADVEVVRFSDVSVALREHSRSDVSGDGAGDIMWYSSQAGAISYYETNSAGGYIWHNIGGVGAGYAPLAGDFNGDGDDDVMWWSSTTGSVSYYDVTPAGGYVWRNIGGVGIGYVPLVGDFSGDGVTDIAWYSSTAGAISYYEINPAGGYIWRNIGGVGQGYTPYAGDFNGDGDSDIMWWNQASGSVSYYDVTPAGGYTWRNIGSVGTGYTPYVGDFNGDGTSDIMWWNQTSGSVSYYEINPVGGYTWHNIGSVGADFTPFIRDFNNDGVSDIGWHNANTGAVSEYEINPAGGYIWRNIGGVGLGYAVVGA